MMLQVSATWRSTSGVISTLDLSWLSFMGSLHAEYFFGKPGEFFFRVLQNMAVIGGMDDSQTLPMVAIGVGAKLVFHLVCLEIGETPHLQDAVFGHGRIPHQIATSLHIVDIHKQAADIGHRVPHDGQCHIVRDVVRIGISQISLHGVTQRIEGA